MIEKSHDGWWKGQTKTSGTKGWFPSNYVKEMPYIAQPEPEKVEIGAYYAPAESPNPNERIVQALYAYTAQSQDELSFDKHEKLVVFDAPSSETNWFRARNDRGEAGLVPRNYVIDLADSLPSPVSPPARYSGGNNGEENVPEELLDDINGLHLKGNHSARSSDPAGSYDDFIDRPNLGTKPWYFGRISRQDCDTLLNTYGQDGDFIIRDSETGNKADFSVSLKASPRNKHFRVYVNVVECHVTIGQRRFNSLEEMIDHYERHPICTNNDGRKLTLMHALDAPKAGVMSA